MPSLVASSVSGSGNKLSSSADVSLPVSGTARTLIPMHLEDLSTLHLKVILERGLEMTLGYVNELGGRVAAHPVGQYLMHKAEDAMWAVEKSIEWSAPSGANKPATSTPQGDETELNGSQKKESLPEGRPSRPLPWIFFIPVLVMWRGTRLVYEAAASLLGKPPVQPEDVVVFLRNRRRGLRALRIRGKRTMKTIVGLPTVMSKMTSLANPFFVVLGKILALVGVTDKKESKRDLEVPHRSLVAEDEMDNAKETVLQKLNRLSGDQDNIEDDPDFEPDSSISSEATTSSGSDVTEEEKEVTPIITDVDDADEAPRPPRTSSFIAEIIEEEDEETVVTDLDARSGDADDEGGDFLSARSSSEIFTDGQNLQTISSVFNEDLRPQNSI